ncbi:MAG: pilus assembly protein, partial [Clostridia bacterium]|nr:pilus assembly protein [Deltaproteobacteria bacterium]
MVPVRQRGQVALVMVIGLLVLAVGMYTTYSIGRTIYAKVKLQNAADAVAYSTAVREARAMNFAAF